VNLAIVRGKRSWAQSSSGWYPDYDERRFAPITDGKGVAFKVFDNFGQIQH